MNFLMPRSSLLLSVMTIFVSTFLPIIADAEHSQPSSIQKNLAKLEASSGGRIGVSAINTANNTHLQYRANERFPMGCTSKVIGVSAILKKSMTDSTLLQQKMTYTKSDLTNWTPITEKHLADGMTIAELCAAAISYSDNTAMNLLVKKLGGLQEINLFARSIGNNTFRADNDWPKEAESGGIGNLADTSTPASMEESLQKLVLGNSLASPQREQLIAWLINNTTGNARIRAGTPKDWVVGDKTGTGSYYGTTNDIAVIWPPKCAPIVVAIYFTQNKKDAVKRDDIVASITRILLNELARTDQCIKQSNDL